MNRNSMPPSGRAGSCRRSRRERAFVLGPLGLAGAAVVCGVPENLLAPLWVVALAWTVIASLALALLAGLRRGDWSAFPDYDGGEDREEEMDLDLRVGGYAFMRDRDRRVLADGTFMADSSFLADGNDPLH